MKIVLLLLFLGLLARDTAAAQCGCSTTSVGLHVRSGPGTTHSILTTLNQGQCLPYKGDSQAGGGYTWYHLDYHGQSAWAASDWMTIRTCDGGGSTSSGSSGVQLAGCPRIITRAEWGARAPAHHIGDMAAKPIYVFIHHGGAGNRCYDRASCQSIVKGYQNYHMDTHGWPDIGYNFVVGEDGHAYEARGWTEIGAHTYGYNHNGIAICIIGDFTSAVPNAAALNTVKQLIQCGLDNGKISSSYTLKGHRDVGQTSCPGDALYHHIQSWSHYASGTNLYG